MLSIIKLGLNTLLICTSKHNTEKKIINLGENFKNFDVLLGVLYKNSNEFDSIFNFSAKY